MNVSDLARRLKVTPQELLEKLPKLGFDIGQRAVKLDNRTAEQIFKKWTMEQRRQRLRGQLLELSTESGAEVGDAGEKKKITLPSVIIVRELAGRLNLPVTRVIQELMKAGILASQNERLDFETAAIIADELGFEATQEDADAKQVKTEEAAQNKLQRTIEGDTDENMASRPPVVVVMGHVDHGKTKTLDAIRRTHVMDAEAGGITQHIGAYQATRKNRLITFIDTPGHEAFTVMRSRGAKVADIAVLVVAADDGVQPQTREVIDIIKAAKIPFVVALNKIDKPEADIDRVLAELAEVGVTTEAWGGDVPMVKISAKEGIGIDDLLEVILLISDMNAEQLMSNPARLASGTIIEAHVDKGEGPVATALVQIGTLKRNDYLGVNGNLMGRVRAMRDYKGDTVDEAPPGTPVKVLGFKTAPSVGDIFEVPDDWKHLEKRKAKSGNLATNQFTAVKSIKEEDKNKQGHATLNVILKADVLGSLEAILGMLEKIQHDHVSVEVIKKGLGNVTENDIEAATSSENSVIYGFNTVATTQASVMARDQGVQLVTYKIIYELIDDVIARLNALLPDEVVRTELGKGEVVAIFRTEKDRMVVGCKIKTGEAKSGAKMIVWRKEGEEEQPVGQGDVESLQVGKEKVKEVSSGQECGVSYHGKEKLEVGDRLDFYTEESKTQKVEMPR
ncbi:MAG: translation initiation factor IF-2 [Patescibacteria group bacterium]|nr:translation initiation factor IF-2 [Patescibacteria group bacterium]